MDLGLNNKVVIVTGGGSGRGSDIDVVVPSWNRNHALILPKGLLEGDVRSKVKVGDYLLGDVNIGAPTEEKLYFDNINEIVNKEEDLL